MQGTPKSRFTGKERDTESGLDYFIARHYASNLGRFLQPDEFTGGPVDAFISSDPLPPGPLPYADITNPQSLNKYSYTYNNPLRYTDPDGHAIETLWDVANVGMGVYSFVKNVAAGDYKAAAVDAAGVAADVVAAVVPGVPGGAGSAIKAGRAASKADKAADATRAADKAGDAAQASKGTQAPSKKSSEQIRKEWETVHGKPWPKDPATGKNQDAHHRRARADGGTDNVRNIEPKTHKQHMEHHKKQGDFRRWGKRSGVQQKAD